MKRVLAGGSTAIERPFPGEVSDVVAQEGPYVGVFLIRGSSPNYRACLTFKTTRWSRAGRPGPGRGGPGSRGGVLGGAPEGDPAEGGLGRLDLVVPLGLELLTDRTA